MKLKHHKEVNLRTPDLVPDFVLSPEQVSTPGWLECYGFIECKAFKTGSELVQEGGGQAINYLATAMNPKTDTSQQSSKIFKFSAFTNGRQIQFFFCNSHKFNENNFITSPVLELFPVDHNAEVVPQGFVYLCQLLTLMSESVFPKFFIKIGQEMATIKKVYQRTENIIVADVSFGSESCLIKQALYNNKSATFSLHKEVMMYKIFVDTPFKTLRLSPRCLPDCLVLQDIGITLKSWAHDILYKDLDGDEMHKQRTFVECISKLFDQIRFFHGQNFTHGDIRPVNVIVLENDEPHLIDFVTATKIGETLQFIHGTVIYMSDDVLNASNPFVVKPIHDLEAFAYSILDSIDGHFSTTFLLQAAKNFTSDNDCILTGYCESRKLALEVLEIELKNNSNFTSSNFIYPKLGSMFFSFLNRLRALPKTCDLISNEDYDSLKSTLSI